ncbi:DUF3303 family protein [Nocardia sp. NPDC024068]|uniref:DUF3303 domain-containing protein n=1 Tax=Nocardia sp. NPDC024068 TaxID=3157197 RepID=UPI00340EC4A3
MKYVISWTYRWNGSAAENEQSIRRALSVFANWKPVDGVTYHQLVGRLDGSGGFAVVETDNPMNLTDAPNKFGFFADYQIFPVGELAEVAQSIEEGASFRESIG